MVDPFETFTISEIDALMTKQHNAEMLERQSREMDIERWLEQNAGEYESDPE